LSWPPQKIRFSGYGLERGGKIDRIAVGKIKTKKNALFRPNGLIEDYTYGGGRCGFRKLNCPAAR
jgi:hypothetical protein